MNYSNGVTRYERCSMIICNHTPGIISHYPNVMIELCSKRNKHPFDSWVMINILIRTLDTFDSRNRVVMTSVNGGVM